MPAPLPRLFPPKRPRPKRRPRRHPIGAALYTNPALTAPTTYLPVVLDLFAVVDGTDAGLAQLPSQTTLDPIALPAGVNAQTGTSYTFVESDMAKLVTFNNASPVATTLPNAANWLDQFNNAVKQWYVQVENRGAGVVTITPITSTIDGAASLAIPQNQGIYIRSDGTNYFTERGLVPALPSADIFVGNASNIATAVALSGDGSIDNTGKLKILGLTETGGTDMVLGAVASGQILFRKAATLIGVPAPLSLCGRLTAQSGIPVSSNDRTAVTTIYYTPYNGSWITLWDSTNSIWTPVLFTEQSLAVPATTSQMYDVFGYLSGGALAIEALAWTNDTTRATGLTIVNGLQTKTGDQTRLYLASFRTTTVSGQTEDSSNNRFLFSAYNRVLRHIQASNSTASWTYSTNTWREANGGTGQTRGQFVLGLAEECLYAIYAFSGVSVSNVASNATRWGIGYNETTNADGTSAYYGFTARYIAGSPAHVTYPAVGFNYFTQVEKTDQGTGTFSGLVAGAAINAFLMM